MKTSAIVRRMNNGCVFSGYNLESLTNNTRNNINNHDSEADSRDKLAQQCASTVIRSLSKC